MPSQSDSATGNSTDRNQEIERILLEKGAEFTRWQLGLYAKGTSDPDDARPEFAEVRRKQAEMARSLRAGTVSFVEYLKEQLDFADSLWRVAPRAYRELSPVEAFRPDAQLEVSLWKFWSCEIPAAFASQPLFWTAAHLAWLMSGMFGDDPMACFVDPNHRDKDLSDDRITRSAMRRMGGYPARGMASVILDCPMARAWWRCHMSNLISSNSMGELSFHHAHSMLRVTVIWDAMFGGLVKRIAVILDPSILAAMMLKFLEISNRGTDQRLDRPVVHQVSRKVARVGLSYSFAQLSWEDKKHIVGMAARGEHL